MPLNWMDVSDLSFNTVLLLEQVQLSWLPGWMPEPEMAVALQANPVVAWYMRHKCPSIAGWAYPRPYRNMYHLARVSTNTPSR